MKYHSSLYVVGDADWLNIFHLKYNFSCEPKIASLCRHHGILTRPAVRTELMHYIVTWVPSKNSNEIVSSAYFFALLW